MSPVEEALAEELRRMSPAERKEREERWLKWCREADAYRVTDELSRIATALERIANAMEGGRR